MNDWKFAITLTICCATCLTAAPSASADFVGVTTVNKHDPETAFECAQANGDFVFSPLTVCNVSAAFDDPDNILLSVGNADLQAYNGAQPDVFFQHPFGNGSTSPACNLIPIFPDLICDSYVTIGNTCNDGSGGDGTATDLNFDSDEFNDNGHIVGGWFNGYPANGQGTAGNDPDLQVLFLRSAVALGLSMSGDIDLFWSESYPGGDTIAEVDVPVECAPKCSPGDPCDDGDPCTENDTCGENGCVYGTPIDCDDGNACTDDFCDEGLCINMPLPDGTSCDDGYACTVGGECTNGKCGGGQPIDCDDDNVCTHEDCDPESGCVYMDVDCEDGNPCTDDYCDPGSGCVNMPNNDPCDDGDNCTENDQCGKDGCVHGTPIDCSDGNECTEDSCNPTTGECNSEPIDCDDGDQCTDDACDPDTGCTHEDIVCPEGQVCDPASGECVADQDPCECVNGRVTLCHIPPGQIDNAHTITVGCAARDKHLAHGDTCGPCE